MRVCVTYLQVSFSAIGGLDGHIRSLKESVFLPLTYPEIFEKLGVGVRVHVCVWCASMCRLCIFVSVSMCLCLRVCVCVSVFVCLCRCYCRGEQCQHVGLCMTVSLHVCLCVFVSVGTCVSAGVRKNFTFEP